MSSCMEKHLLELIVEEASFVCTLFYGLVARKSWQMIGKQRLKKFFQGHATIATLSFYTSLRFWSWYVVGIKLISCSLDNFNLPKWTWRANLNSKEKNCDSNSSGFKYLLCATSRVEMRHLCSNRYQVAKAKCSSIDKFCCIDLYSLELERGNSMPCMEDCTKSW